ncbi:hypothetical protein [Nitrospira sp. Kam-Ns4a]
MGTGLRGLATRRSRETVVEAAQAVGGSPPAVSGHLSEGTTQPLKDFNERALAACQPAALFRDPMHRGGAACVIALGLDREGHQRVWGCGGQGPGAGGGAVAAPAQ